MQKLSTGEQQRGLKIDVGELHHQQLPECFDLFSEKANKLQKFIHKLKTINTLAGIVILLHSSRTEHSATHHNEINGLAIHLYPARP